MSYKLIAITLIGLSAASLIGAAEYRATDYLDVSRFTDYSTPQRTIIRRIVEEHGSKNPIETSELLKSLQHAIKDGTESERHKFGLDRLGGEDLFRLPFVVDDFLALTRDDCHRFIMENLFLTIRFLFGLNLKEFAHQSSTHDANLHAFLLHYSKQAIGNCLKSFAEAELPPSDAEFQMDRMVARDPELVPGQRDSELISMAKQLNLMSGKFKARGMLDAVEDYNDTQSKSGIEAYKRLQNKLTIVCTIIDRKYGNKLVIYNLARLLIPDEAAKVSPSDRFLKLNEYWRVCLPTRKPLSLEAVYKNVARNLPTIGGRFKKLLN